MTSPVIGGTYRHFKGGIYQVTGTARHTETLEEMIIYTDKQGNTWARPASMFNGTALLDGIEVPRFTLIEA